MVSLAFALSAHAQGWKMTITTTDGHTQELLLSDVADITFEEASQFALFGNAVASLCVRTRGAIPAMPERDAVEALLAQN
jgi:sugar/nucleoside kinase (ribokinase family)